MPEIADLCETLIKVAKDYEDDRNKLNARKRWSEKNAAIDAAIGNVQRVHNDEAEQHGEADKPSTVSVCRTCGSRLDKGRPWNHRWFGARVRISIIKKSKLLMTKKSKAKAEAIFSIICKIDLGEPREICQTTFYELKDEYGKIKGTASVTKRLPNKAAMF